MTPGSKIDRYGGYTDKQGNFVDRGTFVSPEGVPFQNRPLPPDSLIKPYNVYEVKEPIPVKSGLGPASAWFGQPGGGTQHELPSSIDDLISSGKIKPIN